MDRTVIYTCPYVPAEWIAAHRLQPRRIFPSILQAESAGGHAGMCPYAGAFLQEALQAREGAVIVVTTLCDQMRRIAEGIEREGRAPVFLLNLPSTWENAAVRHYYRDELLRLGAFLVRCGGTSPTSTELAAVMRQHAAVRATLRGLRGQMSARQYTELQTGFYAHMPEAPAVPATSTPDTNGVPLALVGAPLTPASYHLFDLLAAAGGRVVLNATESGELSLPSPFNQQQLVESPLDELVRAYFDSIPHAFRRPNTLLYDWLARSFAERGVAGIIFLHYLWCDTWQAEVQRMKEWSPLPLLDLDPDAAPGASARMETRVQSFLEMLR